MKNKWQVDQHGFIFWLNRYLSNINDKGDGKMLAYPEVKEMKSW
jgi:hypothetical protein